MSYITQKEYVIIKKHFVMVFYIFAKFFFLMLITLSLYFFTYYFKNSLGQDVVHYFLFPLIIVLLNYSFIKLVLGFIFYYNDLVIFLKDKIIILKTSLVLQDDLEIIDISKIMKIDVQMHGFIANLFGYGNLVLEQQRDELRIFHFIPKPYQAIQLLREKTAIINTGQDLSFFKLN